VATDTTAGRREAKLIAMALVCAEIKASQLQPTNRQLLVNIPRIEDAKKAPIWLPAFVHWRAGELICQLALAGLPDP